MHHRYGLFVALLLATAQPVLGAIKETELPDKEMLKMMEFLRDMEMIKQLDMMREMDQADSVGADAKRNSPVKSTAVRKTEAPK